MRWREDAKYDRGSEAVEVIGFVGASGTGKSYRALYVAKQNHIHYIIDDGLLINSKRVLAGQSAKREKTKIASVRRALFMDPMHASRVREAVAAHAPEKLLILGTSERMIRQIASALHLPEISRMIKIEEIATQEEIARAKQVRKEQGMHVIPVPTFEVKKDFSGYFIDTLKIFLNYGKNKQEPFRAEKTVVRPTYSYMGEYHISDHVLLTLVKTESLKTAHVVRYYKTQVDMYSSGVVLTAEIGIDLGRNAEETGREVQKAVKQSIEYYTSINVLELNVHIRSAEVRHED